MTLAIGGCTVAELQARMTSGEFREWQLYSMIEPFGTYRDDQRAGTIAAVIANVNRKKGSKALTEHDFFPPYEKRNKRQTVDEQIAMAEALNAAFGGIDNRGDKIPSSA